MGAVAALHAAGGGSAWTAAGVRVARRSSVDPARCAPRRAEACVAAGLSPLQTAARLAPGRRSATRAGGEPSRSCEDRPADAARRAPLSPSPSTQRLAQGEWFTSRVSSCGLFTVAYTRASPPTRAELRQLYSQLCHDETPMVRRAAAQRLGTFAGAVERELVAKELLPLFTDLTGDGETRAHRFLLHTKVLRQRFAWWCGAASAEQLGRQLVAVVPHCRRRWGSGWGRSRAGRCV